MDSQGACLVPQQFCRVAMSMVPLKLAANDLISTWARFDWRESFFAPGIVILQALTKSGQTASGAGHNREQAFAHCLSETAEFHALSPGVTATFVPERDGLAAHPDPAEARLHAIHEAFERQTIGLWWLGKAPARPLSDQWLALHRLDQALLRARAGAAQKRPTGWWSVTGSTGPNVVICRSMSSEGQDIILGYGCDFVLERAANKALREVLLMEMNLMELFAARTTGGDDGLLPLRNRIATYTRRCPALLLHTGVQPTAPRANALGLDGFQGWFAGPVACHDITPVDGPLAVWLCQPQTTAPEFAGDAGSPFL